MMEGSIEFYDRKHNLTIQLVDVLPSINATERDGDNLSYGIRRPVILYANRLLRQAALALSTPRMVIQPPYPFPYEDNKVIP